jgi:hypothetical protein
MTYKELVDRIEDAVTRHKMLVDFGYGQLSDIKVLDNSEDGADYPYAFLLPTGITRAQQAVTYSFSLIVMEMAVTPKQILKVQSDCIQYINDLISDLRFDTAFDGDVNLTQSVQVFRERFQDEVAGATLNLQVTVADPIDLCEAPVLEKNPLLVDAEQVVPQTVGTEFGEDKAFTFSTIYINVDNQWEYGNRFTSSIDQTIRIEINYSFEFDQAPGEAFPVAPQLRYHPVDAPFSYVPATTTIGWPDVPQAGVTYTVKQVWDNFEQSAGDLQFVYMEDQPGDEANLLVEAGATIKIRKYN